MKKALGLLCFSTISLINAIGFDGKTLVTLADGRMKPISKIKIDDEVICYDKSISQLSSKVKGIERLTVDTCVEITTQENIVMLSSNTELYFLPKEGTWVFAKDLKVGDCLLNNNLDAIQITKVEVINESREVYAINVDKLHNFLASEGRYLVHNGILAAQQAYWGTKIALYAALGIAVTGTVVATGGAAAGAIAGTGAATVGGAAIGGAAITAVATESTAATLLVAGTTIATTVVAGAEAGVAVGAAATGVGAVMSTVVAGTASATAPAAVGVTAAVAASIESAAMAAYMFALLCPYTPW